MESTRGLGVGTVGDFTSRGRVQRDTVMALRGIDALTLFCQPQSEHR